LHRVLWSLPYLALRERRAIAITVAVAIAIAGASAGATSVAVAVTVSITVTIAVTVATTITTTAVTGARAGITAAITTAIARNLATTTAIAITGGRCLWRGKITVLADLAVRSEQSSGGRSGIDRPIICTAIVADRA